MKIIPLNKKILLKPIEEKETKSSGGIILTERDEPEMSKAKVEAIGDKVELKLEKGDTVIYQDLGADEAGEFIIVDENKIIALIK